MSKFGNSKIANGFRFKTVDSSKTSLDDFTNNKTFARLAMQGSTYSTFSGSVGRILITGSLSGSFQRYPSHISQDAIAVDSSGNFYCGYSANFSVPFPSNETSRRDWNVLKVDATGSKLSHDTFIWPETGHMSGTANPFATGSYHVVWDIAVDSQDRVFAVGETGQHDTSFVLFSDIKTPAGWLVRANHQQGASGSWFTSQWISASSDGSTNSPAVAHGVAISGNDDVYVCGASINSASIDGIGGHVGFDRFWMIQRSTDSGLTWETVDYLSSSTPADKRQSIAGQILVDSTGTLWAVGLSGSSHMMRTSSDGGDNWFDAAYSWHETAAMSGNSHTIRYPIYGTRFRFDDSDNVWALGNSKDFQDTSFNFRPTLKRSSDFGQTWELIHSFPELDSNSSSEFLDFNFDESGKVWVGGAATINGDSVKIAMTLLTGTVHPSSSAVIVDEYLFSVESQNEKYVPAAFIYQAASGSMIRFDGDFNVYKAESAESLFVSSLSEFVVTGSGESDSIQYVKYETSLPEGDTISTEDLSKFFGLSGSSFEPFFNPDPVEILNPKFTYKVSGATGFDTTDFVVRYKDDTIFALSGAWNKFTVPDGYVDITPNGVFSTEPDEDGFFEFTTLFVSASKVQVPNMEIQVDQTIIPAGVKVPWKVEVTNSGSVYKFKDFSLTFDRVVTPGAVKDLVNLENADLETSNISRGFYFGVRNDSVRRGSSGFFKNRSNVVTDVYNWETLDLYAPVVVEGGNDIQEAYHTDIAFDSSGNLYAVGQRVTSGSNGVGYPHWEWLFTTASGQELEQGSASFYHTALTGILASDSLPGNRWDQANAIAVDLSTDDLYVCGRLSSSDNGYQGTVLKSTDKGVSWSIFDQWGTPNEEPSDAMDLAFNPSSSLGLGHDTLYAVGFTGALSGTDWIVRKYVSGVLSVDERFFSGGLPNIGERGGSKAFGVSVQNNRNAWVCGKCSGSQGENFDGTTWVIRKFDATTNSSSFADQRMGFGDGFKANAIHYDNNKDVVWACGEFMSTTGSNGFDPYSTSPIIRSSSDDGATWHEAFTSGSGFISVWTRPSEFQDMTINKDGTTVFGGAFYYWDANINEYAVSENAARYDRYVSTVTSSLRVGLIDRIRLTDSGSEGAWGEPTATVPGSDPFRHVCNAVELENNFIYSVGRTGEKAIIRRGKKESNAKDFTLGTKRTFTWPDPNWNQGPLSGGMERELTQLANVSEYPYSGGTFQLKNLVLGTQDSGRIGSDNDSIIQVNYFGSVVKVMWPKQEDQDAPVAGFGDFSVGQRPGKLATSYEPGDFIDVSEFDHMTLYCYLTKELSGTVDSVDVRVERRPLKSTGFAVDQAIEYTTSGSDTIATLKDVIYRKEIDYGDLSISEIGYPIDIPLTNVREIRVSARQLDGQSDDKNKNFVVWGRFINSEEET